MPGRRCKSHPCSAYSSGHAGTAKVGAPVKPSPYSKYQSWKAESLTIRPKYSVVIPAYNESIQILPTVGAIAAHFSSLGDPWELIVADDGSTDGTVALLQDINLANLVVLVTEENRGKGSAVRRGVAAARGEYILVANANQSTPIEQFGILLAQITEYGCDISIGSRAAAGATVSNNGALRRLFGFVLHIVVKSSNGQPIRDTECGFKLFRASVARDLFSRQVIDGFSFDLEVLYLACRSGYSVAEVPVEWIEAPGSGGAAPKVAMNSVVDLFGIRLNGVLGRYRAQAF